MVTQACECDMCWFSFHYDRTADAESLIGIIGGSEHHFWKSNPQRLNSQDTNLACSINNPFWQPLDYYITECIDNHFCRMTVYEVHFPLLGRNGFQVKAGNEKFAAALSRCRQNFKYQNLTSSFGRQRRRNALELRAARLFFHIQPIKSSIWGVVVAVVVVIS